MPFGIRENGWFCFFFSLLLAVSKVGSGGKGGIVEVSRLGDVFPKVTDESDESFVAVDLDPLAFLLDRSESEPESEDEVEASELGRGIATAFWAIPAFSLSESEVESLEDDSTSIRLLLAPGTVSDFELEPESEDVDELELLDALRFSVSFDFALVTFETVVSSPSLSLSLSLPLSLLELPVEDKSDKSDFITALAEALAVASPISMSSGSPESELDPDTDPDPDSELDDMSLELLQRSGGLAALWDSDPALAP